jgi:hypothetical protein
VRTSTTSVLLLALLCAACRSHALDVVTGPEAIAEGAAAPKKRGRSDVTALTPNTFRIGCVGIEDSFVVQERPDLCWAACLETMERFKNPRRARPQAEIARLAGDVGGDSPGDFFVVQLMLAPHLVEPCRQRGVFWLSPRVHESSRFVDSLLAGDPMIVGVVDKATGAGHAYVAWQAVIRPRRRDRFEFLTGQSMASDWLIETVTLWDPAPGAGSVTMSGQDLAAKIVFFSNEDTARETLQDAIRAMSR